MIKFLLNIIRVVFAIFLLVFFIVKMYFLINIKVHEIKYPDMFGYSYMKIENDNFSPNINDGDYIFLKKEKNISINDYVTYIDNDDIVLDKVKNINGEEITVGKDYIIDIKDIKAKLIYNNKKLSKALNILTNPIFIIIMLLAIIYMPQIMYKRYD